MKISDQKQYKNTVLLCFILEIVLACSSHSLEQFLALTDENIHNEEEDKEKEDTHENDE